VTGVDWSAFLLAHARRYANDAGVHVEWVPEDMRTFRRTDTYDLAISSYTSFGYFDGPAENQEVLANVRNSLRPGGTFIIHVLGREPLRRRFIATEAQDLKAGGIVFQHRRIVDDWTRLDAHLAMVKGSVAHNQLFGFGFTRDRS
jgi:SAM-dependent methyltransferase